MSQEGWWRTKGEERREGKGWEKVDKVIEKIESQKKRNAERRVEAMEEEMKGQMDLLEWKQELTEKKETDECK